MLTAGADEVALIIAEPVQNAGGSITPPPGYWTGLREIADRYGILLMADEVITGFGRIGEFFASSREGVAPDLISVAKGLTSAYAPMGAVLARVQGDRTADRGLRPGAPARHHLRRPPAERRHRAQEHRDLRAGPGAGERAVAGAAPGVPDERAAAHCRSSATSVEPGSSGRWRWSRTATTPASTRPSGIDLIRGFLPKRFREAGLIARTDDRGDAVMQIAPPLISDAALLDEIVDRLGEVLTDAGKQIGLGQTHLAQPVPA